MVKHTMTQDEINYTAEHLEPLEGARAEQYKTAYREAIKAGSYTLRNFYNSWSDSKEQAYKNCLAVQGRLDGYCGSVLSANTDFFTYGFAFVKDEPYSRESTTYLAVFTANHNYIIELYKH